MKVRLNQLKIYTLDFAELCAAVLSIHQQTYYVRGLSRLKLLVTSLIEPSSTKNTVITSLYARTVGITVLCMAK